MILDIAAIHISPRIKICLSQDEEDRSVVLGNYRGSIIFWIEKESEKEFHFVKNVMSFFGPF